MSIRDLLVIPKVGLVVSCAFDGMIKVWDYIAEEVRQVSTCSHALDMYLAITKLAPMYACQFPGIRAEEGVSLSSLQ